MWRGVANPHPWTEESGFEVVIRIWPSAAREEAWFSHHRLQCVVGNETCRWGRALLHPVSCVPTRYVGGCGRMRGNGLVEEGLEVLVDWTKIDCREVWGGWCRSLRRIESRTWCYGGIHGFSGYHSRSYDQMELDFRGSHLSRYWGAATRRLE